MVVTIRMSLASTEIKSSLTQPNSGYKVQYSKESEECSYYVYSSKGGSNSPILIWVESFSYLHSEVANFEDFALRLSSEGVTLIRLNYRVNDNEGKLKFTDFIKDCLIGYLNIVNDNRFKDNEIYLGGHCSGALLATLIALDSSRFLPLISQDKGYELNLISRIEGILVLAGTFDLSQVSLENDFFNQNIVTPAFIHTDVIQSQQSEYNSKHEATLNSDYNSFYNAPQPAIPQVSNTNRLVTKNDIQERLITQGDVRERLITAPVLNGEKLFTKDDIQDRLTTYPTLSLKRLITKEGLLERLMTKDGDIKETLITKDGFIKERLITKDDDIQEKLVTAPVLNGERLITYPTLNLDRLITREGLLERLITKDGDIKERLITKDGFIKEKLITKDDDIQEKLITAPVSNGEKLITKDDIQGRLVTYPTLSLERFITKEGLLERLMTKDGDIKETLITKDGFIKERLITKNGDIQEKLITAPVLNDEKLISKDDDIRQHLIPMPDQQKMNSVSNYSKAEMGTMRVLKNDNSGIISGNQSNCNNVNNFNSENFGINKLQLNNEFITLSSNNGNGVTNYIVPNSVPIVINERMITIGGKVQNDITLNKLTWNTLPDNPNSIKDERMDYIGSIQNINNSNLSVKYNNTQVSNPSLQSYNNTNLSVPQNATSVTIDSNLLNYLQSISPQHITSTSLNQIPYKQLPKILVIHSTNDSLVHSGHSLNFIKHLNNLGFNRIRHLANNFGDHNLIHKDPIVIQNVLNFIIPSRVSLTLLSSKL